MIIRACVLFLFIAKTFLCFQKHMLHEVKPQMLSMSALDQPLLTMHTFLNPNGKYVVWDKSNVIKIWQETKPFSKLDWNVFFYSWHSVKEYLLCQSILWSHKAAWLYLCKSPRFNTSSAREKLNVMSAVTISTLTVKPHKADQGLQGITQPF